MKLFILAVAVLAVPSLAKNLYGSSSGGDSYAAGGDSYSGGGSSGGGGDYAGDSYAKDDGYGAKVKCTPYYDTVFSERCEQYTDRVCRTNHQESCTDVPDKNCRAVVTSRQIRQCFNVTELVCKLREDVQYEVVQVGFTVQKCHKVQERVCDTVYDTAYNTKDDFQCLNVQNPYCNNEEYTINDKTCRTTTSFDCDTGYGGGDSYGSSGGDSYGSGGDSYGSSGGDSYGSGGDSYGSGGDSYGDSYDDKYETKCRRSASTKCYNTPRTVSVQKCGAKSDKVCEKMTERMPYAQEKQHCHNEDKKVCELEERTQPKQVKKYVYTKQCRSVPRRVCENADVKQLVPSCVGSTRKQCSHSPVEKCEDVPKKHCYKVAKKIKKEKCETVKYEAPAAGYDAPAAAGYESGSDSY